MIPLFFEDTSWPFSTAVTSEDHRLAWSQWQRRNSQDALIWESELPSKSLSLSLSFARTAWSLDTHTFPSFSTGLIHLMSVQCFNERWWCIHSKLSPDRKAQEMHWDLHWCFSNSRALWASEPQTLANGTEENQLTRALEKGFANHLSQEISQMKTRIIKAH